MSSNKIKSGGGNSAMSFVSVNGNYNFRDAGDTANTGQIRAGNVTFRSQSASWEMKTQLLIIQKKVITPAQLKTCWQPLTH